MVSSHSPSNAAGGTRTGDTAASAPRELTTSFIFHVLRAAYEDRFGRGLFKDYMATIRVLDAAENARAELTTRESITVSIPFITPDKDHLSVALSRAALLSRRGKAAR